MARPKSHTSALERAVNRSLLYLPVPHGCDCGKCPRLSHAMESMSDDYPESGALTSVPVLTLKALPPRERGYPP